MLFLIVIVTYLIFFIFDYLNIKKSQNKKQNIMYMAIFFISFTLSLADVFELPIPKISNILRAIIKNK